LQTWQIVFILVALPGLPAALLIWSLQEPPRIGRTTVEAPQWPAILGFISGNRYFIIPFILGMAFTAAISLATLSWIPALLMRSFHLSPSEVGVKLGFVTMGGITFGLLSGAWLNEAATRRGVAFPALRISLAAVLLTIVPALMLGAVKTVPLTLAATFVLMVFTNIPFGIAGAALQSVTPNEMRGRVSAIYLFTQNAVGMTFGPLIPALLTDHLFDGDGTRLSLSLGLTITSVAVLSGLSLLIALRNRHRLQDVSQVSASPHPVPSMLETQRAV
jgi:MFS family permease